MRTRTLVIVLIAAALLVAGAVAMRGQGSGLLAGWMQSLHGGGH